MRYSRLNCPGQARCLTHYSSRRYLILISKLELSRELGVDLNETYSD